MFKLRQIAALAIVASCAVASGASAKTAMWPTSIVGTWSGLSNQSQIILTVSTQTPGGKCQGISGTIEDVATQAVGNMLGYYCPGSGAVEFMRYPTNSNVAFQAYTANVNQINAGAPQIFMGGTFSQYSLTFGPLGQYSVALFK